MRETNLTPQQVKALHRAAERGHLSRQGTSEETLYDLADLGLITLEDHPYIARDLLGRLTPAGLELEAALYEPDTRPWPEDLAPFTIPDGIVPTARLERIVEQIRARVRTWRDATDLTPCAAATEAEVLQLIAEVLTTRMVAGLDEAEPPR
jgi:hypothetical protein